MQTVARIVFLLFISFLTSPSNAADAKITTEQKQIMHLVLSQTSEVHIHQMRGATGNKVYVNELGQEVVFDEDGEIVLDGINDGSYNYFHYGKQPFEHYVYDIEPWIKMGHSENDPTSIDERIYAYMGDLEGGIHKARKLWSLKQAKSLTKPAYLGDFPKSWVEILERPGTKSLFGLVNGDIKFTKKNVVSTMRALDSGFGDVY